MILDECEGLRSERFGPWLSSAHGGLCGLNEGDPLGDRSICAVNGAARRS